MFLTPLLSVALAAQICPDALLDRPAPDAASVIRVVLERCDLPGTTTLPLVGAGPERNLYVCAQVLGVEHGTFSVKPLGSIRLALHSIAISVGYDHVGEQYLAGLGRGQQLLWLVPAPDQVIRFRATVVSANQHETPDAVTLIEKPDSFARLRITEVGDGGPFRVGEERIVGVPPKLVRDKSYCFIVMRRGSSAKRPFRLIRIHGDLR